MLSRIVENTYIRLAEYMTKAIYFEYLQRYFAEERPAICMYTKLNVYIKDLKLNVLH
jgi:hypothetical protein